MNKLNFIYTLLFEDTWYNIFKSNENLDQERIFIQYDYVKRIEIVFKMAQVYLVGFCNIWHDLHK